ncbi:hypothetical protein F511_46102 [Dorcoceras hygrometricum]|uniref:Uncharacterized protein n=1 Tax=Dorcoceras hygrometricum TaxID=472368 RepID=A0A2Z7A1D2_9LAMI|nr:hypothetical protein F511_46102 [Dorcoceras hygrometricum]
MLTKSSKELEASSAQRHQQNHVHAEALGVPQLVSPDFLTSITRKRKSQGVQRHLKHEKRRLDAMEISG